MTSMIEVRFAAWKEEQFGRARAEGVAQGRAEGVAKGRAEGAAKGRAEGLSHERTMLSRQAARRFGVAAGRAVAEAVAEMDEPVELERIGDLIVDCPTGERFLLALASDTGQPELVPLG